MVGGGDPSGQGSYLSIVSSLHGVDLARKTSSSASKYSQRRSRGLGRHQSEPAFLAVRWLVTALAKLRSSYAKRQDCQCQSAIIESPDKVGALPGRDNVRLCMSSRIRAPDLTASGLSQTDTTPVAPMFAQNLEELRDGINFHLSRHVTPMDFDRLGRDSQFLGDLFG